MTELCVVKKVKSNRNIVYVELKRTEKCKACKICSFNKQDTITVPAVCDISVDVGQTVKVEMPSRSVGSAALLIYVFPLLLTFVGAAIGLVGEWWLQLILAAVGLTVGFACSIPVERYYRKKTGVLPVVLQDSDGLTTVQETNEQINENGDK